MTFFNVPKHRVFNYQPRYYDAEKEEFDERVRKVEDEIKQQKSGKEYVFRHENISFRKALRTDLNRREVKLPSKRLFVYAVLLLFVGVLYVTLRNFTHLINTGNQKSNQRTEFKTGIEKHDWDSDAIQIVIVDDEEIPENTSDE